MALTNHSEPPSHVVIANVGSGDIFFMDVARREIVGCVNVVGAGGIGTASAHAATAAPDNSIVIVADIAGNALHKILTNYEANTYRLSETLELKAFAGELGTSVVKPICLEFTADSRFAYVTLAGGGVLVVKVGSPDGSIPMSVAKVYKQETVPGIGCGAFRLPSDAMLTTGESGASGGDDFMYIFDTSGAASGNFSDPIKTELPGDDTHGVVLCTDPEGQKFAVTTMRVSNDIVIVDLQTQEIVHSQSMAQSFSPDPKPDIADLFGNKMLIALRGPVPLTAIVGLKNPERIPGVAVLTLNEDCKSFNWEAKDLASMSDSTRTTTLDDGTAVTAADPHGLVIVRR